VVPEVLSVSEKLPQPRKTVIPAQAGIQFAGLASPEIIQIYDLNSRLRGNDGWF